MVSKDHFITRADHWESFCRTALLVVSHDLITENLLSFLRSAMVEDEWYGRCPLLKLILPIRQRA